MWLLSMVVVITLFCRDSLPEDGLSVLFSFWSVNMMQRCLCSRIYCIHLFAQLVLFCVILFCFWNDFTVWLLLSLRGSLCECGLCFVHFFSVT